MPRPLLLASFMACGLAGGCKHATPSNRAPRIVVTKSAVWINGKRAATRADLEPTANRYARVMAVDARLKELKERWNAGHPHEAFVAAPHVVFPVDIPMGPAAKLLQSLVYAGYATDITVRVGDVKLTFDAPESMRWYGAHSNLATAPRPSAIVHFDGAMWHARELHLNMGGEPVRYAALQFWRACGVPQLVDTATVADAIRSLCPESCNWLFVDDASTLHHAARFVAPLATPTRSFRSLVFTDANPCATKGVPPLAEVFPPTPAPLSASAPPAARIAALDATGELSRDAIEAVVRRHLDVLRACYAKGLASHPDLRGNVGIVLRVDADGRAEHGHYDPDIEPRLAPAGEARSHERVLSCMVHSFEDVEFPASTGTTTIRLAIQLTPKSD